MNANITCLVKYVGLVHIPESLFDNLATPSALDNGPYGIDHVHI